MRCEAAASDRGGHGRERGHGPNIPSARTTVHLPFLGMWAGETQPGMKTEMGIRPWADTFKTNLEVVLCDLLRL